MEAGPTRREQIGFAHLLAPTIIGLGMRAWNWREQVLGDDELHAVRAALSMPLREVWVTWQEADHSIPLTALYRVWLDAGGVLSDGVLRAPVLLGSAALLLAAPRLLAPIAGARLALLWAWALALSPMLVLYGRMVRSYSLTLALATVAVLAFARFWRGDGNRFAGIYGVCGAAAIVFHLGSGPFVVSALGVGAASWWLALPRAADAPGLRALGLVALGLLGLGGAALAPGAPSLMVLVSAKSGVGGLDASIIGEVVRLHAGSTGFAAALVFWVVVAAGCAVLWRSEQRLLGLLVVGTWFGQLTGLLLLAPELDSPTLATRAFLVTLPMSLLGAAAAVDTALSKLGLESGPRRIAALVGLAAAVVAVGPFAEPAFWRTSFRQHDDYLVFTRGRPQLEGSELPAFYRELAALPDGAVVELPWHPAWGFGHAIPAYQERHGRSVVVSNGEPLGREPRLALRRYVYAHPQELLASDARYAIVHADLGQEEQRARAARDRPDPTHPRPAIWRALRLDAQRIRRGLDAAWGPPDRDDGVVAVWDLERIRRERDRILGAESAREPSTER